MRNRNKQNIDRFFTGRMFGRQYVPALISALVLSFGDIADSLVLGNRIGYIGLAALALIMPVSQAFNIIMNAFGIGGSVRFAHHMARGKREEAAAGFQSVLFFTVATGVLLAVFGNLLIVPILRILGTAQKDGEIFEAARRYLCILLWGCPALFLNYVLNYYMKAADMEKQASIAFTTGNVIDIGLNVVLVLLLHMGVTGAALATVIGQAIGLGLSTVFIIRKKETLTLRKFKLDVRESWVSFRIGLSSSIEFFYSTIFLLIANNLLIRSLGGVGVAILDVVLGVSYFMTNLYDAVVKSILPVVSTYSGERNEAGMRHARNIGIFYVVLSGFLLGAAVFLFPDGICRFFGMEDPAMLASARTALRMYAASIPLAGIGMLLTNYYEARQLQRQTLIRSTIRGVLPIIFALVFAFLLPKQFFGVYVLSEALALIAFSLLHKIDPAKGFDGGSIYRGTIYSTDEEVSRTTSQIEEFCERSGASPGQRYMAMMFVEEICIATMKNGFMGKEDGFIQIVLIVLDEGGFELHIRDNAASYNPLAMEFNGGAAYEEANLDALGIVTIKKKAKSFSYRHFQGFNTVVIEL